MNVRVLWDETHTYGKSDESVRWLLQRHTGMTRHTG